MNSLEVALILKSLKSTKKIFLGVFACDELPDIVKKTPALLVCNTQPSNSPGEHWIAIYISKKRSGEYFDSFGLHPQNILFIEFLKKNCINYKYNQVMVQSIFSNFCGQFCIIYAFFKSQNKTLNTFLKLFKYSKLLKNNSIVVDFFYKNICNTKTNISCWKLFNK